MALTFVGVKKRIRKRKGAASSAAPSPVSIELPEA